MRDWAREALRVRPGETALDVGSGTGSEVVEFARLVGESGRAVGVDPNPSMLRVARERSAGEPVEFLEGSAYELPLEDSSVDVVRCERVYQHLDDPAKATAEVARVLAPGGRVVLIDSDWSTSIMHPGDPEIFEALRALLTTASPNRNSGRRLRGLLTGAGLVVDDLGSEAVVWDPEGVAPMYAAVMARGVAAGAITEQQREQVLAEFDRGVAAGDYHFSVTMFAVLAHKP
ncbi:MAG: methyltransferase domain-containing protein [Nocardia sp.]|nr:methyltransferase domain-containing protein [Nocardia sp.]